MKRLCTANDVVEAQLFADMLRQDGIEVRILNQYALGALGEIPFTHAYPELWLLDERDRARAEALLEALHGRAAQHKACSNCGEDIPADLLSCWHCGVQQ